MGKNVIFNKRQKYSKDFLANRGVNKGNIVIS
jgi:hypothetical protein